MRPADVQSLRKDLKRAELLVRGARNLMSAGVARVDAALALLAEAQAWLPQPAPGKPFKIKLPSHARPEAPLFHACSVLVGLGPRLDKALRARRSSWELGRARELVRAAVAELREAWLAYLYAHGLPFGYKPVRTLFPSGGIGQYTLWVLAASFGSKLAQDLIPKDRWWSDYLFPAWAGVCVLALVRWGTPDLEGQGRPSFPGPWR
ncbi:MAG: hypothetical protein ACK42E_05405 [Candidatus Bipolaricaulaceae bacterium]